MRYVLITGASGGIGAAIAEAFARAGYGLVLHYHKGEDRARALAARLTENYSVPALPLCADLSDTAAVQAMFERAAEEFGFIDTVVNNAGIAEQKLFTDLTDEAWDRMINVNLSGTFRTCRAALPEMIRKKQGTIINVSSMWGQVGASCEVAYSAAKAGVIGLTKALAKEVAPSGITVNCIAPGAIRTPMLDCFTEEDLAALAEETPVGRIGTPEDVAASAVFLASEGARFITGQVLGVNGGFVI
ncbi:MAG: 3-oxoacyl-ACP reductase FabG [Clostridia bacterium]|nr:3-oxoacyl-ACP reductase FabG [Clostridia bacterium]